MWALKCLFLAVFTISQVETDLVRKSSPKSTLCTGHTLFFVGREKLFENTWQRNASALRFGLEYGTSGLYAFSSYDNKMFQVPEYEGIQSGLSPLNVVYAQETRSLGPSGHMIIDGMCTGECVITWGKGELTARRGMVTFKDNGRLIYTTHRSVGSLTPVKVMVTGRKVKVFDNVSYLKDTPMIMTISTTDTFQYTKLKANFIIHEYGGKDELLIKFPSLPACVQYEYFSRSPLVSVKTNTSSSTLEKSLYWSREQIQLEGSSEVTFKLSGSRVSPDFGLGLFFSECGNQREAPGTFDCIDGLELTSLGTLSPNTCPGFYGANCSKICQSGWVVCADKKCTNCFPGTKSDDKKDEVLLQAIGLVLVIVLLVFATCSVVVIWYIAQKTQVRSSESREN